MGGGITYAGLAGDFIAGLKAMMDAVIAAEMRFVAPVLKSLALMYIGRQSFLLMRGDMGPMHYVTSSLRVLVIAHLIGSSGQYVQRVRDPVFDLPQTLQSAVLSGAGVPVSTGAAPAQQFDRASAAGEAVSARIQERSTAWSISSWVNALSASAYNGWLQAILSAIFAFYMVGQALLAVVLCFGPFILLFELFERTRGWVDQWLGKIVGIVSYGMGTAILLALQMTHLHRMLAEIDRNLPSAGAEAVAHFAKVVSFAGLDLILMLALPAAVSYGSGVAAGVIAPVTLGLAAKAGGAVGGVATRAAKAGARRLKAAGRTSSGRRNAVEAA